MQDCTLKTPVAFLIFNRPDTTAKVFAEIARARPQKLLVIGDGPRPDRPGEAEKCAAVRAIVEKVEWPCEVLVNYADVNMGCKRRISSGLNWLFASVDEAIVLEDDCLPHPSFFRFCEELLQRYRDDYRVMHISGDNFQFGQRRGDGSYYFSRYPHIWGWASWRRAWQYYDAGMNAWGSKRQRKLYLDVFVSESERRFWRHTWDEVWAGRIDTWDYQWVLSCVARMGLSIVPNVNLVSNIGFGESATHVSKTSIVANLPTGDVHFPLRHPSKFSWDEAADRETGRLFFRSMSVPSRVLTAVRRHLWAGSGVATRVV